MNNLWGDIDEIININNPRSILEEQAKYLSQITGDLVYGEITSTRIGKITREKFKEYNTDLGADFSYRFELKSKYVDGYKFNILYIIYGIKIYPLCVKINPELAKQIPKEIEVGEMDEGEFIVDNEQAFLKILGYILKSEEVRTVVKNLKYIAEDEKNRLAEMEFSNLF